MQRKPRTDARRQTHEFSLCGRIKTLRADEADRGVLRDSLLLHDGGRLTEHHERRLATHCGPSGSVD